MTIEELKQAYEPEGVYAGMTQAEALRYLAKRYLRKPECVALCNEVANNLPKLLKVAEAAKDLPYLYDQASADPYDVGYSQVSDEIELLRKALEELSDD
jgi:hypothetical protein